MNHRTALRLPCEQVFGNPVFIVRNDRIGHVQDFRRRAIVLVQNHVLVGGELHETLRLCSPPLINRLVRITDHEQIPMPSRQLLDDLPIIQVAVLGFVHHYVVQLVLPIFPGILEPVQDIVRKILKVIKVQGIFLDLPMNVVTQI